MSTFPSANVRLYLANLHPTLTREQFETALVRVTTPVARACSYWFPSGSRDNLFAYFSFPDSIGASRALSRFQDREKMRKIAPELLHPDYPLYASPAVPKAGVKDCQVQAVDESFTEDEISTTPLLVESIRHVAQAVIASQGQFAWIHAVLMVLISYHSSPKEESPSIPEEVVDNKLEENSELPQLVSQFEGLEDSSDDGDSEPGSLTLVRPMAAASNEMESTIIPDELLRRLMLLAENVPSSVHLRESAPPVPRSHLLFNDYMRCLELCQEAVSSPEALVSRLEEKEFSDPLDLPYPYAARVLSDVLSAHQQGDTLPEESWDLYTRLSERMSQEVNADWRMKLLSHAVQVGIEGERVKHLAGIRPRHPSEWFQITNEDCSTSSAVLELAKTVTYQETTPPAPAPPAREIITRTSPNTDVQDARLSRATVQEDRMQTLLARRNISPQEHQRRHQEAMEVGRTMEIQVKEKDVVKKVKILCAPETIQGEIVFDKDFGQATPQQAREWEQQLLASMAKELEVPTQSIRLSESVAGSWKVKFSVVMANVSQEKRAGEIYDRITHDNYLEELEKELRMAKKSASARLVWVYYATEMTATRGTNHVITSVNLEEGMAIVLARDDKSSGNGIRN